VHERLARSKLILRRKIWLELRTRRYLPSQAPSIGAHMNLNSSGTLYSYWKLTPGADVDQNIVAVSRGTDPKPVRMKIGLVETMRNIRLSRRAWAARIIGRHFGWRWLASIAVRTQAHPVQMVRRGVIDRRFCVGNV